VLDAVINSKYTGETGFAYGIGGTASTACHGSIATLHLAGALAVQS
jgi:hypothetical protein